MLMSRNGDRWPKMTLLCTRCVPEDDLGPGLVRFGFALNDEQMVAEPTGNQTDRELAGDLFEERLRLRVSVMTIAPREPARTSWADPATRCSSRSGVAAAIDIQGNSAIIESILVEHRHRPAK